ncbi:MULTISPECIES: pyridoxine 5'-phosphate synthase [unclassified Pseudodesulfovibrio]|uniref:pyridoxine 5'-phosphate synthase n=1 Tax=unclassified Pseudodesulfovibrio TaxID=2661612 RepID=UPI000FEC16B7|nr:MULTISPECIES: pyridoxine 5'-phosphate synthase [unclassified Pseudodesulfovibrio]MCJ2163747.1 pyridoxine 5'-phosphate synthase [Pseudodesulfovibrio sp. S3-i]RWU06001.1 pyridoxine 5'-phosphate synthase [Pseudodesulfovibrio sp. S3]
MPVLVVNVDHVATLRQARMGIEPEPVTAAYMAEMAGATGIIVHLREDRRHIQDRDVELIKQTCNTRLHLEMAATKEMQSIAINIEPEMVCLVPEKRQELTTEGGLDCIGREKELRDYLEPIHAKGIRASLFIDADPKQIEAASATGAEFIEIHTGHYADAKNHSRRKIEFEKIIKGIALARNIGMKVNLGHGLNYRNILYFKDVPGISEYSIGHAIMARAIYVGMDRAVRDMAQLIRTFTD